MPAGELPSKNGNITPVEAAALTVDEIAADLAVAYPDLTLEDRREVAGELINEIRNAIRRGDKIGIISPRPGGGIRINYLTVEPTRRMIDRFRLRKKS